MLKANNVFDVLKDEHRIIVRALHGLNGLAEQAVETQELNKEDANELLTFFTEYADKLHHAKEEDQLFPHLETKGLPREGGPTGVMIFEHNQGRGQVLAMKQAVLENDIPTFSKNASEFFALLSQHIQKEDHCLFGMAAGMLTMEDNTRLMAAFEEAENQFAPDTREKFERSALALFEKYAPQETLAQNSEPGSCSH